MSDSKRPSDLGDRLKDCILDHFIGKHLGSGAYRKVFELCHWNDRVIKIETNGTEFCNVIEMQVWQEVQGTPIEKWFAPCVEIDAWGLCLIQKKTTPFECQADFNKMVEEQGPLPNFFDDVHWGNWGEIEGKLVCHDYGFNKFLQFAVKGCVAAHEEAQDTQMEFKF